MTDRLLARHSESAKVAYGERGERSARALLCDAAAVAQALPEPSADKPLALLGVRRDGYDCIAALLGIWARGYEVLLPAADCTREGFLQLAQRPDVGPVIHDTASTAALPIAALLARATPESYLSDLSYVQRAVLQLSISEALPEVARVRVSGAQLLREASLFGQALALPERGTYACSLLLSSRYAWAAGVFWPLLSGGALLRGDVRAASWPEGCGDVLIAAPSQLRALLRVDSQALQRAQRVVSLGAPLPAAAFERLHAAGLAVSDVYACQHLGSLGVRSAAADAFQPLPEVSLSGRDSLSVSAPHVTDVGQALIHATPAADGGFIATGVGSERARLEEQIAWLDGVHDAALISLSQEPDAGWHVALSLDESPGEAALRRQVIELLPEWPISAFCSFQRQAPAAVSSVSSFAAARCDLARNGAGRHDRSSLLRLFGRDADTQPLAFQLTQLGERVVADADGERYERQLQVPSRYAYFVGHFPGYPILPGAAQLSELVVPFVRSVRPQLGRLIRMARLKFQERIVPNDVVQVSLQFTKHSAAAESSVDFTLRRGESLCANGRLVFALDSEPL